MSFSEDIKRIRRKTMKLIDDYCKRNEIDFDISEQIDNEVDT